MKARRATIHFYKSRSGWRWRLKAGNGEIVTAASESFTRRSDARRNFATVRSLIIPAKEIRQ